MRAKAAVRPHDRPVHVRRAACAQLVLDQRRGTGVCLQVRAPVCPLPVPLTCWEGRHPHVGTSMCVPRGWFSAGLSGLGQAVPGGARGAGGAAGGRVQGRGLHPRCARPARRPHAPGAFAAVNSRRLECQAAAVAETRRPGRGSWWWLRPPCRVPSGRRGPAVTWLPPAGPGSARSTLVGRAPACRRLCRFPGLLLLLAGL